MVHTLLAGINVLMYLLSDVVLIATFLMNRPPSTALGGAIPVKRLASDAELFSLPPRVFGCTAFVQDHTPNLSKPAPRALKGVFVGYSRTQKGYRIYFPATHHYVTSADVTFHEDVPFFSPSPLVPAFAYPPNLLLRNRPLLFPHHHYLGHLNQLPPLPLRPSLRSLCMSPLHRTSLFPLFLNHHPLVSLPYLHLLSRLRLHLPPTSIFWSQSARVLASAHNIRSATTSLPSISHYPIVSLASPSCLGQFPRHILKLCRYQSGRLLWMQNMPHSFNERLGRQSLARQTLMFSRASGCTPSSTISMAPLMDIMWW